MATIVAMLVYIASMGTFYFLIPVQMADLINIFVGTDGY